MPGQFGNKGGRRPSKKEEIQAAIEEITEQALLKLARSKVFKHLNKPLDFKDTKEMALPIVVKGMAQKLGNDPDNPLPVMPIYAGQSISRDKDAGLPKYDSNQTNIPTVKAD